MRNAQGVRQIVADPKYPKVKVPPVEDDAEYEVQLGVYEGRCLREKKRLEDEAEKERQLAVAAAEAKRKASEKKVSLLFILCGFGA